VTKEQGTFVSKLQCNRMTKDKEVKFGNVCSTLSILSSKKMDLNRTAACNHDCSKISYFTPWHWQTCL